MADDNEVITVAELTRRLGNAVARVTGREWVEGEVASLKRSPKGHVYFTLKDEREEAIVECVMYRFEAMRARRWLQDGARLQLLGNAMLYAPRGRLQLKAVRARPAGRGALLEALEKLKKKLAAEGLFEAERKRPLPAEPKIVGVVTSATGAAFHDICKVAFRRSGVRIVLSPALVQGDEAPGTLCRALRLLERYPALDVIIVGRGGGSGEDLMAFNDERVVRTVARCSVPIVSAVGHEIDTTLTDLVADVRAATPSQAAELAVPDASARLETLRRVNGQLWRAMVARIREDRSTVERAVLRMEDPRYVLAIRQQHLDELRGRLERCVTRAAVRRRARTDALGARLRVRHPRAVLAGARADVGQLSTRLVAAARADIRDARSHVRARKAKLEALSPVAILGRGYSIATGEDGRAILSGDDVRVGQRVSLRLHRGGLEARVEAVRAGDDDGDYS